MPRRAHNMSRASSEFNFPQERLECIDNHSREWEDRANGIASIGQGCSGTPLMQAGTYAGRIEPSGTKHQPNDRSTITVRCYEP